jgi:hypothetical protein
MKVLRWLLLVVLVGVGGLTVHTPKQAHAKGPVCYAWSVTFLAGPSGAKVYSQIGDYTTGEVLAFASGHLDPGETRTVSLHALVPSGKPFASASITGGYINDFPENGEVAEAKCAPPPPPPGPDMVPIPDDAVMGTFTADTALYFQPDVNAATAYTMGTGQSLWVYGLDSSGAFYQVLLSGDTYWVPVSSIGPTNSPPWNGTPLPSGVVQQ